MSANLPINWADKKNSPLLADFIAKHGSEYCMTAEEINQLRNAVNEMAVIQQSTFLGTAEPATTPAGTGRAYWIALKSGTYPNYGGVVVGSNEIAFIVRDAAGAFSISKTGLDLSSVIGPPGPVSTVPGPIGPQGSSLKVPSFVNQAYPIDSQVNYLGKDWISNTATVVGDIPGTSIKWGERLSGYLEKKPIEYQSIKDIRLGKNLFDKDFVFNGYLDQTTGALVADVSFSSTDFIKVNPSTSYYKNGANNGACFYDINKSFISSFNTSAFTTTVNTMYVRVTLTNAFVSSFQLELGSVATAYKSFTYSFNKFKDENTPAINDFSLELNKVAAYATGKNLIDKSKLIQGFYIGSNGALISDAGFLVTPFINIKPSSSYYVNSNYGMFFYDVNFNFIVSAGTLKTYTAPANAMYFRTATITSVINILQLEEGAIETWYAPFKVTLNSLYAKEYNSKWFGKEVNFLGDSITWGLYLEEPREKNRYTTLVANKLEVNIINNYGLSSSYITKSSGSTSSFVERSVSISAKANLNVIFGGVNDFRGSIPLGLISSTNQFEFYGALKALISTVLTANPTTRLCFLTPILNCEPGYDADKTNALGLKLVDYVTAIINVCQNYSIPVYDMYRRSGFNPFTQSIYTSDGLHPNSVGSVLIASQISKFLDNL